MTILSVLFASPLCAEILLTGVVVVDKEGPRFVLEDTRTKTKSGWILIGSTFGKYRLSNYDQDARTLLLTSDDDVLRVKLVNSAIKETDSTAPAKAAPNPDPQKELARLTDDELLARGHLRVKAGATFRVIAASAGISVQDLVEMNPDVDLRRLRVGQVIRIAPALFEPSRQQGH